MSNLILCTQDDASDWLSIAGLESRFEDDLNQTFDTSESDRADRLILRASSVVSSYLAVRYNRAEFAGANPPTSTPMFVRHCTAIVFTYFACARRQNPASGAIKEEYERVLEYLKQIQSGDLQLEGVADSYNSLPFMSNPTVVGAANVTKIRILPTISVGGRPPSESKLKQYEISPLDDRPFFG